MANKYSFVTLWDGDRVTDHLTVSRQKGDHILRVLHGLEDPANQKQADFLLRVKSVHPSLSDPHRAHVTAEEAKTEYWDDLDAKKQHRASIAAGEHLTNTGQYQSKDMALPENDR